MTVYLAEPEAQIEAPLDTVLLLMVEGINSLVNPIQDGSPINLFVRGILLSGQIIPDWQWFEEQANLNPGAPEAMIAEILKEKRDRVRHLRDRGPTDLTPEQHEEALAQPAFIHLKNCRVFMPQPVPSSGDLYWRGRLADISGWSYGQLIPST
ncbi:hypothetical protein Vau01_071660 [Virgisporangium aurantiacum]|uniref:Uncharacterized protein n=1 Tax=Virgisporangium aurantiacum TaxID=175570 RepID=A0A8J4E2B5_9ACTN|nr:hypothetical protein Vau01_071660 [Virgisporangium aurantiacum]